MNIKIEYKSQINKIVLKDIYYVVKTYVILIS